VRRLTKVFRLLGNELAILVAGSTAETPGGPGAHAGRGKGRHIIAPFRVPA
jgi:hypothetical protein